MEQKNLKKEKQFVLFKMMLELKIMENNYKQILIVKY